MNLDRAVETTVAYIQRNPQTMYIEAVRKLWKTFKLSNNDIRLLASEALAKRVSQLFTGQNQGTENLQSVTVNLSDGLSGKATTQKFVIAIIGYKVNGVNKVILEYTSADCEELKRLFAAEIAGYAKKIAVLDRIKTLLRRYQKTRVSELPLNVIQEIDEQWRATLRDARSSGQAAAAD